MKNCDKQVLTNIILQAIKLALITLANDSNSGLSLAAFIPFVANDMERAVKDNTQIN